MTYNTVVKALLSGKDLAKEEHLESTDEGQNTPIIWAARQNISTLLLIVIIKIIFTVNVTRYSMNHMLEILIAHGANVNYQGATESLCDRGIRNSTALHWAVRYSWFQNLN